MPSPSVTEVRAQGRRARRVRWIALLGVLALSTGIGLVHQYARGTTFWLVGVDALCPFGGVEVMWAFLASGEMIKRVALSSIILLAATVIVAIVMGRSFCGQVCPLGTLQELFARIGIRITGKRFEIPAALDRPARYLKYVALFAITYLTWRTGTLIIRPYDPWAAYHHLTSPELLTGFGVGLAVLGISVAGSFFYDRFFCKYLCPMGALLALISRLGWFRITRSEHSCTQCGLCDKACPTNVDVSAVAVVKDAECISCSECVNACPVPETLTISGRKGGSISALTVTVATLAVFFGVIGVSTAAGAFEWTKPTLQSEMRGGGGGQGQGEGEESHDGPSAEGGIDTSVIKGKHTMNEIASTTGIPAETLQAEFGLSDSEMDLPLKDVKDARGFSMNDVRDYVGAAVGAP